VEAATAWPADLLVIGTHGRRGLDHLLLGSIAESVVRLAPMPVLLVRGQ
jgi:nucleotide-binding universal stress UspA family protein